MKNALAMPAPSMPMPKGKGKLNAKKVEDDDNRGEVKRIVIEFTENGFNTCVSFEPDHIDPKFDRYNQLPEDEEMSYGSKEIEDGLVYVGDLVKKHLGYEKTEEKPTAGKKAAAPTEAEAE